MVVRGKVYQAGSISQMKGETARSVSSPGASQGRALTSQGRRGLQQRSSRMHSGGDGSLGQSSGFRAWCCSHCAGCCSRASLVALKHRVELPRRAVLLPHELDRAPGSGVSRCGDASRHLGVDASHGAENSRGGGPHDRGVALYRRLEDGLICRGRLRRHDRCVCEYLLTHSFADDCGDAYRFHRRETARGRRSQGTEISFSSGRPMTFLPEGVLCSSGRTRTLLRRGRAYPSNCVLVHDGYLWQRQVLGRLWHSS